MIAKRELVMGMPAEVVVSDAKASASEIQSLFDFWQTVDDQFSPYKPDSEVTYLNLHPERVEAASPLMRHILSEAEMTKRLTNGYFEVWHEGRLDPSGIVKGWAILQAAQQLANRGYGNFRVEISGDMELRGANDQGEPWRIGIAHPFEPTRLAKVLSLSNVGMATSGSYRQGSHIYDPVGGHSLDDVVSLTVVGPNADLADRMATAAFAMGGKGMEFIESLAGYEAYGIDRSGRAIKTSGFDQYVVGNSQ